jgi:ribonuclease VapC
VSAVVVDTSAITAILSKEPGADWLVHQLDVAEERLMAAPTAVELAIVLEARAPAGPGLARRVLRDARIRVVSLDDDLAERALDGWRRFGKGRHPAAFNLGDCFTYALADSTGLPILCVGDDFRRTDLPTLVPGG